MTLFNGKVKQAFGQLRKEGFFARMNFRCCQTCAWSEVPEDATNVVFYHNQDNTAAKKDGELYLSWSGDASVIRRVCEEVGLQVIHDGSEHRRIVLKDTQ